MEETLDRAWHKLLTRIASKTVSPAALEKAISDERERNRRLIDEASVADRNRYRELLDEAVAAFHNKNNQQLTAERKRDRELLAAERKNDKEWLAAERENDKAMLAAAREKDNKWLVDERENDKKEWLARKRSLDGALLAKGSATERDESSRLLSDERKRRREQIAERIAVRRRDRGMVAEASGTASAGMMTKHRQPFDNTGESMAADMNRVTLSRKASPLEASSGRSRDMAASVGPRKPKQPSAIWSRLANKRASELEETLDQEGQESRTPRTKRIRRADESQGE